MTEQEQKELAEWAAEWLELEISIYEAYVCNLPFPAWGSVEVAYCDFFGSDTIAPILAHLAKRKMDNVGWEYAEGSKIRFNNQGRLSTLYWSRILKITRRPNTTITDAIPFELEDENNFIALWLAIREAVKSE